MAVSFSRVPVRGTGSDCEVGLSAAAPLVLRVEVEVEDDVVQFAPER